MCEMLEYLCWMEWGIFGCFKVMYGYMGLYFDGLVGDMWQVLVKFFIWVGELYFEFYCGIFILVVEVKVNNCCVEVVMWLLEVLVVYVMLQGVVDYLVQDFVVLWDVVLLNQFYDILFGLFIGFVYEDSCVDFVCFFE